jgi:hypothetical protein
MKERRKKKIRTVVDKMPSFCFLLSPTTKKLNHIISDASFFVERKEKKRKQNKPHSSPSSIIPSTIKILLML